MKGDGHHVKTASQAANVGHNLRNPRVLPTVPGVDCGWAVPAFVGPFRRFLNF